MMNVEFGKGIQKRDIYLLSWAEEEAKRAKEQCRGLEEARKRWETNGLRVVVDKDLQETGIGEMEQSVLLNGLKRSTVEETEERAKTLMDKLKEMAGTVGGKSGEVIFIVMEKLFICTSIHKRPKKIHYQTKNRGDKEDHGGECIAIMKLVRHPNIVELKEFMATKTKIFFVMEFVRGGELFCKISKGKLHEDAARRYFQQLISAVDYCHSRGISHRDLKPENLLLDENGALKISDFGLSALPEKILQDGS